MRKFFSQLAIEITFVFFLFILLFCSWLLRDLAEVNRGEFASFQLPKAADIFIQLALIISNFLLIRKISIVQKHQKTNELFAINLYLGGSVFVVIALFHGLSILSIRHYYNIFFKVLEKVLMEEGALLFAFSSYYIFRNTSLLKKDMQKINAWKILDGLVILSFLFIISAWIKINIGIQIVLFIVVFIVAGYISVQQEWIAYQSRLEKLNSIVQLTATLFVGIFILALWENQGIGHSYDHIPKLKYLAAPSILVALFCVFAIGTLVFSFPASNHYDLHNNEFDILVRLSGTGGQVGTKRVLRTDEEILMLLLEDTAKTYYADQAWVVADDGPISLTYKVDPIKASDHEKFLKTYIKDYNADKVSIPDLKSELSEGLMTDIRSVYTEEIKGEHSFFGKLVLVWHLDYGFDEEVESKIEKIIKQAVIALENTQNIRRSMELQRYHEQISIAKTVQKDLLPKKLSSNQHFEIDAQAVEAEEVGGDYYEIIFQNGQYKLIIADVSGKGTKAAFYMAQLKGAIQALTTMDLPLSFFVSLLNKALLNCLTKGNFITLSCFEIDPERSIIRMVRAGHCPALYYHAQTQTFDRFTPKGIGLGLISSPQFEAITELFDFSYHAKDLLVLFTDGITEARNPEGEEFGIERLENIVRENTDQNLTVLNEIIIKSIHVFTRLQEIDDDFTVITLRFL